MKTLPRPAGPRAMAATMERAKLVADEVAWDTRPHKKGRLRSRRRLPPALSPAVLNFYAISDQNRASRPARILGWKRSLPEAWLSWSGARVPPRRQLVRGWRRQGR